MPTVTKDLNSLAHAEPRKRVLVLNAHEYQLKTNEFDELKRDGADVPLVDVAEEGPSCERDDPHEYWMTLVRKITECYSKYDGFVIMQGIDTMCNTAAVVSFLLENLGKSVVLTGAVSAPVAAHTDWRRNFILAALYAAGTLPGSEDCCEVVIIFAERVFRGTRAMLESSSRMQPFISPKFPPLGVMQGHRLQIEHGRYLRAPTGPLIPHLEVQLAEILLLTVTPSANREAVMRLVQNSHAKGLVIQAFGAGNVPYRDRTVIEAAQYADRKGMVVVVSSQVRRGGVELGVYYTGGPLARIAVSAGDMTVDATVAKLKYLLGRRKWAKDDIKVLMTRSLRGELTEADPRSKL
jgi:L-asparaginase